ncbi:hypothetical protein LEMLEM_LOCUS13739, partial [Lemmus lemmus]
MPSSGLQAYKEAEHCILHQVMVGDRDRDPHWSTGLSSQGPDDEQKKGEHEQRSQ